MIGRETLSTNFDYIVMIKHKDTDYEYLFVLIIGHLQQQGSFQTLYSLLQIFMLSQISSLFSVLYSALSQYFSLA